MTEAEETKEPVNPMGAKVLSKIAMLLAGLWILVGTILKGFNILNLEVWEIITCGLGLIVVWAPAYASIYMDKLKALKELSK